MGAVAPGSVAALGPLTPLTPRPPTPGRVIVEGRERERRRTVELLVRLLLGVLLVAHGLVHLMWFAPHDDPAWPFRLDRSWLISETARKPVASDEASPVSHSSFITSVTDGSCASAGTISSACAPSTTMTGDAPASTAEIAARRTSGSPSWIMSCFE